MKMKLLAFSAPSLMAHSALRASAEQYKMETPMPSGIAAPEATKA